jgi:hypothetical protein
LGLAGAAAGQNQWLFDITYSDPAGVINSLDDTATVTLWAAWDPSAYAFDRGRLDSIADDPMDAGEWSDPVAILHADGSDGGVIEGEVVTGIVVWQVDGYGGYFADTSNPIAVWTATWRTSDLSPRSVFLRTETDEFWLYVDFGTYWIDVTDSVNEGAGAISIVPGPGAVPCVLLLPVMTHGARRRR